MAKKILVVEDEDYLAEMYKMKFKSEGYNVTMARNGQACLDEAKKTKFDLILLDLVMPGLDGFIVLQELRSRPETKKTKIYILSNLGQEEEITRSFNDGADGFIIKANITPAQLMDYVERIFKGEKVGEPKPLPPTD